MTDLRIDQDVLVENRGLLGGEAFIASVDTETLKAKSDALYVDVRDRDRISADIAMVQREDVVTMTEVFNTIKSQPSEEDVRRIVQAELEAEKIRR